MSVAAEDFGNAAEYQEPVSGHSEFVNGEVAGVLQVDRMHALKSKALDVAVFLALSGSILGVTLFDLWVLVKLRHLVFG